MPAKPHTRQPTRMAAFTAMAPGEAWARAAKSSISSSLSHFRLSTNLRFIKVTITNPPPKVNVLIYSVAKNSGHSLALSQRGAAAARPALCPACGAGCAPAWPGPFCVCNVSSPFCGPPVRRAAPHAVCPFGAAFILPLAQS